MAAHTRSEDSKAFKKVTFEFGGYKIRYAWVSQRGYYPEDLDKRNQDTHIEVEAFGKDKGIEDTCFFGVFDGHGKTGDFCSIFTRDNLPGLFVDEIVKNKDVGTIETAYKSSFVMVNKMLHDDKAIDDSMSGTTAICCLFKKGTVYVANVGDSRAVMGEDRHGKLLATALSIDQTPFRKDERERCKAAGAVVANMDQMDGLEPMHENWTEGGDDDDEDDDSGDPPRVWLKQKMVPGCAFTRSIGDAIGEQVGVFAQPEVLVKELAANQKYVVIASDGVWEFLTNQTVINMVAAYKSPLKACKAVVNESYKLWLQYDVRTDDITMIAIYLEEMGGLEAAHEADRIALENKLSAGSATSGDELAKRRQSVRELRRKSSAFNMPANVIKGATPQVMLGSNTPASGEEARPVRRVMTKEKRKVILSESQDDAKSSTNDVQRKETGFKYTVVQKKLDEDDISQIASAVATNFLLTHLNEQQKSDVFGAMEICECKAGDTIITAGQPGEWFYVVHSGQYDAYIDGVMVVSYKDDESSEVGDRKHGTSFGELALLYHQQARAASIMCSVEGQLWRLHAKTFREVVMRSSTQQLLKTLRSVEVLRELTLSQLQRLFDALSELRVKEGTYVIREGEPGTDFYIVMEGSAQVLKHNAATGKDEEVMPLKRYDYFGERALLNNAPRAASVMAKETMKLLQISKVHFEEVLGSLDDIIDTHRRKREEGARRQYLQRQAEGLLDSSAHEFEAIYRVANLQVSDLYVVRRLQKDDESGKGKAADQNFVLRVYSKKRATDDNVRARVMSEIKLFGDMMPSPFIPALLATFSDRSKMYAVLGTVMSVELSKHPLLESEAKLDEETARFVVGALILAMMHLHRQEIVCRMLALDTVVLDSKGYPQLVDFTLAKKLTDCGGRTYTLCGVAEYNAPEQVQKTGHGISPDWWALGILTYDLIYGKTPFAPSDAERAAAGTAAAEPPPPAPEPTGGDNRRIVERRPSFARLLVVSAAGDDALTISTYKRIIAYATNSPQVDYPNTKDGPPSKDLKELIDDLLDPKTEERLGCRGSGATAVQDFYEHGWFKDFNFIAVEDGSQKSPFLDFCKKEATDACSAFKPSKGGKFEAPAYVGDNRWCDDWDYTCTVGTTVEDSTSKATQSFSAARRNSVSQDDKKPSGGRRGSAGSLGGIKE